MVVSDSVQRPAEAPLCPQMRGAWLPPTSGTFTHSRGALEFGSVVGEVVEGCLMAHWFQLERETDT